MRSSARVARPLTYRFSGTIFTSSFPGIEVGDRFFGRFRFDPGARLIEATAPETRYADPHGFVDALVGAFEVKSAGVLEIQVLNMPSIMRLSLSARYAAPGDPLVGACGVFFLSSVGVDEGLPASLDAAAFVTRTFTLESADYTGFAEGALETLYPLDEDSCGAAMAG
jgi:hypothetical protein